MKVMTIDEFKGIEQRFVEQTDKETYLREISFACQAINKSSQLQKCQVESTLEAVLNISQVGLTLNPVMKLAYLIPRWDSYSKKMRAVLEPSYQGLVKLITDTGSAKTVFSYCVYEGDEFEEVLGTTPEVIHKPLRVKDSPLTHAYAVAILHDGTKQVEVMDVDQLFEIRDRSEGYKAFKAGKIKSCIWDLHEGEMCRKTVIKRLAKYLPKTDRWDKLSTAIELTNLDYQPSYGQIQMIEGLIDTASVSPEEKAWITTELDTISSQRATELIEYLKEHQTNALTHQANATPTEITKEVKAIAEEK